MKKNDKQISIRLPNTLLDAVQRACTELNENQSTIIKRSIFAYLDYYSKVQAPIIQQRQQNIIKNSYYERED